MTSEEGHDAVVFSARLVGDCHSTRAQGSIRRRCRQCTACMFRMPREAPFRIPDTVSRCGYLPTLSARFRHPSGTLTAWFGCATQLPSTALIVTSVRDEYCRLRRNRLGPHKKREVACAHAARVTVTASTRSPTHVRHAAGTALCPDGTPIRISLDFTEFTRLAHHRVFRTVGHGERTCQAT